MKIVVLSEDTIIDGKKYRKGEVVQVEDSFDENVERTIKKDDEQHS